MTCIVGIGDGKRVWIGADSAAVEQSHYLFRASEPKVFTNCEYLIGFTTSFRMGQILQHQFVPPKSPSEPERLSAFMASEFSTEVRTALAAGGWLRTTDGRAAGGSFLVGVRGRIFYADDDFNMLSPIEGYGSVGCGTLPALGSMFATERSSLPPDGRIMTALLAAEMFVTGVRGPFTVMSLPT